ncbi:E3 ubiquitin-protein ligase MYCBP2 [Liparis tanakae]|uniref:E3 ubiquitin-protein ligase MYCBP2 n=1 Tax=Liparis tanakae TaxID=230148 RepID=A0A4Z2HFA6_9TELE|nr:E3 ubiquitin-protein ligase MYCBP2 [Liparis tanakae]
MLKELEEGQVTDLKGHTVIQVAMGKAHTCVLNKSGEVWTFGVNNKAHVAVRRADSLLRRVSGMESVRSWSHSGGCGRMLACEAAYATGSLLTQAEAEAAPLAALTPHGKYASLTGTGSDVTGPHTKTRLYFLRIAVLVTLLLKPDTYQVEVDGLLPASRLHQQLVRQDAVIGAVPVAVVRDAAGLPVLVERLLETCKENHNKPERLAIDVWKRSHAPLSSLFLRHTLVKPSSKRKTTRKNNPAL